MEYLEGNNLLKGQKIALSFDEYEDYCIDNIYEVLKDFNIHEEEKKYFFMEQEKLWNEKEPFIHNLDGQSKFRDFLIKKNYIKPLKNIFEYHINLYDDFIIMDFLKSKNKKDKICFLEQGKFYKTRSGKKAECTKEGYPGPYAHCIVEGDIYPYNCQGKYIFSSTWCIDSETIKSGYDIVSEWTEEDEENV